MELSFWMAMTAPALKLSVTLIMVALSHIFVLWFLLSSFFLSFPRLISAIADWMSTILAHMVWP